MPYRSEDCQYLSSGISVLDSKKEIHWFRYGLLAFCIAFISVLVSRSGFFYGVVFRFGDEAGKYNRYDLARIGLLISLTAFFFLFSTLLTKTLRNRSNLWFEKLPVSWRGISFKNPAGTHFYAATCLIFFCLMPLASVWLNLDRYMGGDVCFMRERIYTGWKGHLFQYPAGPGYSRCPKAAGADVSYGKSMDYIPIIEPWGLLILSCALTTIFIFLLSSLFSGRNHNKFVRKLAKLVYIFDLRSASLTKLPSKWAEYQRAKKFTHDIFLSYSYLDVEIAGRLQRELTDARIKVWFDSDRVSGGENFVSKIENGLLSSRWLVAICSNDFMRSRWGRRELLTALLIENEVNVEMVIPLSYKSTEERIGTEFVELERRNMIPVDDNIEEVVLKLIERIKTNI